MDKITEAEWRLSGCCRQCGDKGTIVVSGMTYRMDILPDHYYTTPRFLWSDYNNDLVYLKCTCPIGVKLNG